MCEFTLTTIMCECFQKNLSSRSLIIDGNYFVVYFPHFAVSHASVVKIMDISPKHFYDTHEWYNAVHNFIWGRSTCEQHVHKTWLQQWSSWLNLIINEALNWNLKLIQRHAISTEHVKSDFIEFFFVHKYIIESERNKNNLEIYAHKKTPRERSFCVMKFIFDSRLEKFIEKSSQTFFQYFLN